MTKVVPIEREIQRLSRLMDDLWDNPKGGTAYELFIEGEYNRLVRLKKEGQVWYVPF